MDNAPNITDYTLNNDISLVSHGNAFNNSTEVPEVCAVSEALGASKVAMVAAEVPEVLEALEVRVAPEDGKEAMVTREVPEAREVLEAGHGDVHHGDFRYGDGRYRRNVTLTLTTPSLQLFMIN